MSCLNVQNCDLGSKSRFLAWKFKYLMYLKDGKGQQLLKNFGAKIQISWLKAFFQNCSFWTKIWI